MPLVILDGIFIEPRSPHRSCHLTPSCGLEVQNPTHALKSVKGLCNTFEMNRKWTRTLPLGILDEIFFEPPSWILSCYLTPYCGLEIQNLTQALKLFRGLANTINLNP